MKLTLPSSNGNSDKPPIIVMGFAAFSMAFAILVGITAVQYRNEIAELNSTVDEINESNKEFKKKVDGLTGELGQAKQDVIMRDAAIAELEEKVAAFAKQAATCDTLKKQLKGKAK